MATEYENLIAYLFSNEFILKCNKDESNNDCDLSSNDSDLSIDNKSLETIFAGLACIENSLNETKVAFCFL